MYSSKFKNIVAGSLIGVGLFILFVGVLGFTISQSVEQRHRHEIECIQAGGHTDTITSTCTK